MIDSTRVMYLKDIPSSSGIQDVVGQELDRQASLIPPIPEILLKLDSELDNEWVNITRLANLVRTDPTLSASVLRLVNSPAMRGMREILDLEEAIQRMGKDHLRTVAAFYALHGGAFPTEGLLGESIRVFWRHSLLVAAGSVLLSRTHTTERVTLQEIWTAGLLHDIGALFLPRVFPEPWKEYVSRLRSVSEQEEPIDFLGIGRSVFGCDHSRISEGFASRYWKSSPSVSLLAGAWTNPDSLEPSWAAMAIRRADEAAQVLGICWQSPRTRLEAMQVLDESLDAGVMADPQFCIASVRSLLPLVDALLN
ncbi:MAG TPA: HDOD domain-containing protein [Fibrobacteria bacterium]|nr:HDOD domain-containing protein [Fibrobacteria bacterium]HOX50913.1 HDOD domain-containing protein [Fibrobacteria bacterium]